MTADFRSDTITRPTPEMYAAMASAPLGDDVLGDEPTVTRLQELAAQKTGKEAALFVPSGTMANQIALACHTNAGDSILVEDDAHILYYECAAPSVIARVLTRTIKAADGVIPPEHIAKRALYRSDHTPGTTLLCLENTHNRHGGAVTDVATHREYRAVADRLGMKIHLDGARVFNAAVALGVDVKEITAQVDSVSFCLSKGLCSPVGSLLCGSSEFITKAHQWRKRLGGAMRQSGVLAACGIVSLEKMIDRLADDHRRAKVLGEHCSGLPGLAPLKVETNIVMVDTDRPAEEWCANLEAAGVRCFDTGPNRIRFVTHNDVDDDAVEHAKSVLTDLAERLA